MLDTSVLNVDFEVLGCSTNCKALKIVDLSNWGPAITNPSYIDITTPGSTLPVTVPYQKQVINIFNTNNLNLSDVTDYSSLGSLPDGAYQICVRVCMGQKTVIVPGVPPAPATQELVPVYESVCKYWLQDCQLRCAINRKLLAIDLTCQPCRTEYLDEILEIQMFLEAAHAQMDNCNVNKAMEYYRRACLELDRFQEPGMGGDFRRKRNDCPECWPGNSVY